MNNPENLTTLLAELEEEATLEAVKQHLESGQEPRAILDALNEGMSIIGEKYTTQEYFLVELIMAAAIFEGAMEILKPALEREGGGSQEVIGRMVIGTVQGDLHDIGKNIFVGLARNAGFLVNDLGIDVPPETFVEQARKDEADIVGMSGILTMALQPMAETVKLLQEAGLRDSVKVIIGGLSIDGRWSENVGADAYTDDAYEGLNMIKAFMGVE